MYKPNTLHIFGTQVIIAQPAQAFVYVLDDSQPRYEGLALMCGYWKANYLAAQSRPRFGLSACMEAMSQISLEVAR